MRKLLYLVAVLCFVAPGFSAEPSPQSKEEFLRSLFPPTATVPAVMNPEAGGGSSVPGLDQQPGVTAATCSESMACTNDLQCSPGACAGGYCFCGCIVNWPCGSNTNNCGLDGYCLRGHCFCL